MRGLAAAALAVLLAGAPALGPAGGPAWGQTAGQPAVLPARDVDVTYRSVVPVPAQAGAPQSGASQGQPPGFSVVEQRSRFSVAAQRTRLDMPTPGLFSIMDYRTHTMAIISEPDRKVLETQGATPRPGAGFVRRGQDQVAGLACTEWEAIDSVGQPALTCFTDDGVMLRVRRGTQVLAVATRVDYAAQDARLFQVPAGYERIEGRPVQRASP